MFTRTPYGANSRLVDTSHLEKNDLVLPKRRNAQTRHAVPKLHCPEMEKAVVVIWLNMHLFFIFDQIFEIFQ